MFGILSAPAGPTTRPARPTKPIKRHSKSCKRCLKRKQRCHGFPVCSACEEARQPCEPSEYALRLHSRDSSYAAYQRIRDLETQLAQARQDMAALRESAVPTTQPQEIQAPSFPQLAPEIAPQLAPEIPQQQLPFQMPMLFDGAIDSSPGATPGQVDLGDGSFYSMGLATDPCSLPHELEMEQMVEASVWTQALSIGDGSGPGKPPGPAQPDDRLGRRMLAAYFDQIHPRYPFLEHDGLYRLHTQRFGAVPDAPSLGPSLGTSSTASDTFDAFKLSMVYAIGGTLLKLTDHNSETHVEGLLAAARRHLPCVLHQPYTLETVEAMALLVLYSLRSLSNAGIWYMVGLAMRTCIDLGLHLESSYSTTGLPARLPLGQVQRQAQNQKKRNLFWSVYILERFIALSLRRPFSIAENDIETRPPAEADGPSSVHSTARLAWWAKLIQIKRFESRIQADVGSALDRASLQERLATKVYPWLAALDAWGQSLPPFAEAETRYLQLHWSQAVAQLLRPFLGLLPGDDPLLRRCLHAAGHICDIFKQMHQRHSYGHSFVSAHNTFISGVTMCYCLFLAPKLLTSSVANSLRACSLTMFVIAERSPRLRKHRDVLDDIIGRIMDAPAEPPANALVGAPLPLLGTTDHVSGHNGHGSPAAAQRYSQHDFMAVQSLLNLAAQQEPQGVTLLEQPLLQQVDETSQCGPPDIDAESAQSPDGPMCPVACIGDPGTAFRFDLPGSRDIDRYILEMLGGMARFD